MGYLDKFENKEYRDSYVKTVATTYLARQIRVLRKQRGLTQRQLAQIAGIPTSAVSHAENPDKNNTRVDTLITLASALDVGIMIKFGGYEMVRDSLRTSMSEDLEVPIFEE